MADRAAFLPGRNVENKVPRHSFLPDPLHLRKCLCELSSALWSGILVLSPFFQELPNCSEGGRYWGEQRSSGVREFCLSCLHCVRQTQHQWVQLSPLCAFGCHYSLWARVSQLSSADEGKGFLLLVLDIFST